MILIDDTILVLLAQRRLIRPFGDSRATSRMIAEIAGAAKASGKIKDAGEARLWSLARFKLSLDGPLAVARDI